MTTSRKPLPAALWATVVVVGLVAYPLSFGPAVWLADARVLDIEDVARAFKPVITLSDDGPAIVRRPLYAMAPPAEGANGRCSDSVGSSG